MQKSIFILISLVISCLGLTGCGPTMMHNLKPEIQQSITKTDWPTIGERTSVYVGDAMLVQGEILETKVKRKVLIVNNMVDGACYDIPPGTYNVTGDDEKRYYAVSSGTGGSVVRAALCDSFANLTIPKDTPGKLCVQTVFGVNSCYDADFTITDMEIQSEHAFDGLTPQTAAVFGQTRPVPRRDDRQTLIYSGLEGKIAKFTYVTGTNFQNSVSYDLSKSNIINYKGARIEIHKYDNEQITYTVLRNFPSREALPTRSKESPQ